MTALTERDLHFVPNGVDVRKIVRAVVIRNRVPLLAIMCCSLASASLIYWLSFHIVVRTSLQTYENSQYLLYFRLVVFSVPFLVGVLGGAPILATEYESGSFRFTQTQGVGRRRLLLITLTSYLVVLVAGSGLVGIAIDRFRSVDNVVRPAPSWAIGSFFSQSMTFLAIVVASFCVCVFVGAIVRRTVAGITTAVATLLIGTLLICVEFFQKSLAFMSTSVEAKFGSIGRHSHLISYWVENGHGGRVINGDLLSPAQFQILRVTRHYTFWVQSIPASHYQAVQFLWFAIFALVAAIAIMGAFWRLGGNDRLLPRLKINHKSSDDLQENSSFSGEGERRTHRQERFGIDN